MFKSKLRDFGFIILCPNRDIIGLRNAVRRVGYFYPEAPCLAVKPKGTTRPETADMKAICDVAAGKVTDQSMINAGLKKAKPDWNFIVYEGAVIRPRFHIRYGNFLVDEKDVLFPIIDQRYEFFEGTMNGLLIHRKTWEEVGPFEEEQDFLLAKLLWAAEAKKKDVRFKGILGPRVL